jgi:phospho-N-acetylmuramoyl-pentapeptide-transferase
LPSEQIFLALFGAICGFLILNIRPASIFMGDCGSLALGSIFGANLIALWVGTFGVTLPLLSIIKLGSMLAFVPLIDFASVGFNIILAKLKKPRFFFAPIHQFNSLSLLFSIRLFKYNNFLIEQ